MWLSVRAAQASADLRALAAPGLGQLAPHLEGRFVDGAATLAALEAFVANPVSALEDEASCFVLEDILLDEDLPDALCQTALALHMAERLSVLEPSDSVALVWPLWSPGFANALPSVRCVWMNAAREMEARSLAELDPIDPAHCLSQTRDAICAPLCAIAREAIPDELEAIAMSDYGDRWDEHLRTLKDVIENRDCVIPEADTWFPLETVQLKSHVPGELGHIAALAVLLVTMVRLGDRYGDIEFRWEKQAEVWRAFSDRVRRPVLAAVRHLYEADPQFLEMVRAKNRDTIAALLLDPP